MESSPYRCRLPRLQWRIQSESDNMRPMDEGRKRVLGIMAAILASLHMQTADHLFGGPGRTQNRTPDSGDISCRPWRKLLAPKTLHKPQKPVGPGRKKCPPRQFPALSA